MTLWWNKKWGKNKVCGISYARLRPGKNKDGLHNVVFLRCGHGFYRNCIKQWAVTQYSNGNNIITCPLCRREFDVLDLFK